MKTFPGVRALDGVRFELQRGEVHALVGENGAGKSTLINLLAGVHQPDSGAIIIEGQPVRFSNPHVSAQHGIGVVFQERSLCPNLSIAENIFADRQPLRRPSLNIIDWASLRRHTAELLRQFRLPLGPDLPVKYLSSAFQQLVEILKAISLQPRILILDEPTSSLSAGETELLFDNLRRLKRQGMSFVYVSHHLPEIFAIADRVTVFRDGRQVHTCATQDISETELINRMVGRELTDLFGQRRGAAGPECFRIEQGGRGRDFRDITFAVRRGEIVGLAGLAGAGRTELGRGIFGVEPLDTGRLYLEGAPITVRSPTAAIEQRVGYLTENRKDLGLFLDMTVRANCVAANLRRFASRTGLMDENAVTAFARACVQDLNIVTPTLEQKVVDLSGGNQQKVLLALWLAVKPRFLIVDEPTRGVDVGARSEIYHRLRDLAASGVGLLMISSDLTEILGMSNRILVMRNGGLVREFAAAEATEQLIIAAASGVAAPNDNQAR